MKTKFTTLRITALALLFIALLGQSFAQPKPRKLGLIPDDAGYLRLPKKANDMVRLRGFLSSVFTLKGNAPTVFDQGNFGYCVPVSTTVYTLTMGEARIKGLTGQQSAINQIVLSPTFVYERAKDKSDINCQKGMTFPQALEVLKREGAPLLSHCAYQCGNACTGLESEAAQHKILGYQTLFDVLQSSKIERITAIRTALQESQTPVLIGMMVPRSFFGAGETWRKAPGETMRNAEGGHAMAIIGYNEKINGGSFEIINSWGTDWGNKGFTYANAEDLLDFTPYAFQMFIDAAPGPAPTTVTLKGGMDLILNSGGAMPVSSVQEKGLDVTKDPETVEMITYKTTEPNGYFSGTSFKAAANNSKTAFMYILGSDEKNRLSVLFPRESSISPLVSGNAAVMLPAKDESITLDNVTGTDYMMVLYSDKELNITEIEQKIKAASGSFVQRVYTVLGSQFIAPHDIKYAPSKIDFEVQGNPAGSIVPLLVKIKHA